MGKVVKFFKNLPQRYLILALVLAATLSCVGVSGVFAKYQTNSDFSMRAGVAKWGFKANINGVSCDDTEWGAEVVDAGYSIPNVSLVNVNYMNDATELLDVIDKVSGTKNYKEYQCITPGTSGLLSVEVDPHYSVVGLIASVKVEMENMPKDIIYTDIFGVELVPTYEGNYTFIEYSRYFSAEELSVMRAWMASKSKSTAYIEMGIYWNWPNSSEEYPATDGSNFNMTVKGKQVISESETQNAQRVHFVTFDGAYDFEDGCINVLTDNITIASNMSALDLTFSEDTFIDLNGYFVSLPTTINSSEDINLGIGTRICTSGVVSVNEVGVDRRTVSPGMFLAVPTGLTVNAPNASVFCSADLVGDVSVSTGLDSFHMYGRFVASNEDLTEIEGTLVLRGGQYIAEECSPRTKSIKVVVKQDTSAETKEAIVKVNVYSKLSLVDTSECTAPVLIHNSGRIDEIIGSETIDTNLIMTIEGRLTNEPEIGIVNKGVG